MDNARKELITLIEEWNASRLDLFHISIPDEMLVFHGVMRFFFQDYDGKYQTKCLKVSSATKTDELIVLLLQKFHNITRFAPSSTYGLYEHYTNSERQLKCCEHPLLVQLHWPKLRREGKFILKSLSKPLRPLLQSKQKYLPVNSAKRYRFSLKRDKKKTGNGTYLTSAVDSLFCRSALRADQEGDGASSNDENCIISICRVSESRRPDEAPSELSSASSSPPDSSFTRTISDPETIMQKTRQETLGAKLTQITANGCMNMGGTLKIYGELIDQSVPYKTLLLSINDPVSMVVRQVLDKYGLEDADPSSYCLVMRMRYAKEGRPELGAYEEILSDTTCPLSLILIDKPPKGVITTFELRPRLCRRERQVNIDKPINGTLTPSCLSSRWPESVPSKPPFSAASSEQSSAAQQRSSSQRELVLACLVEYSHEDLLNGRTNRDGKFRNPSIYPLPLHLGQVCIGTAIQSTHQHPLLVTLPLNVYPDVSPFHALIYQPNPSQSKQQQQEPTWLACVPCNGAVFINGRRLPSFRPSNYDRRDEQQFTQHQSIHCLSPGDVIQLGSGSTCFRIWPGSNPPLHFKSVSTLNTSISTQEGIQHQELPKFDQQTAGPKIWRNSQQAPNNHQNGILLTASERNSSSTNKSSPWNKSHHANEMPDDDKTLKTDSSRHLTGASQTVSVEDGKPVPQTTQFTAPSPRPTSISSRLSDVSSTVASSCVSSTSASTPSVNLRPAPPGQKSSQETAKNNLVACSKFESKECPQREQQNNPASMSGGRVYVRQTSQPPLCVSPCSPPATPGSGSIPLLDRLPCQLAYAPMSLESLLDCLMKDGGGNGASGCPLGPTFTIYLMLRAICRQCDRWEAIEERKLTLASPCTDEKSSSNPLVKLKTKQRCRRQQELVNLFTLVVNRFVAVEGKLSAISIDDASKEELAKTGRRAAMILANASQLLHFVSKDIDLQAVFQSTDNDGVDETETRAWTSLTDRLAGVIETIFDCMLAVFTFQLGQFCLPSLVASIDSETANDYPAIFTTNDESDPVLRQLDCILAMLHAHSVNPAFLVQLFARLLHFIGARLFNEVLDVPARVSPQWGHRMHDWIHRQLTTWAERQGLGLAVDCYLARLSQATDLMQASMNDVESLYNTVVDLDRLNSIQVRYLLEAYRPEYKSPIKLHHRTQKRGADMSDVHSTAIQSEHILSQWIDFIISGVQQVSDKILAEEDQANVEEAEEEDNPEYDTKSLSWKPRLFESLELRLPLLLPDDCYPSSVPIRNPSTSIPDIYASGEDAVEVADLTEFLQPALSKGWCRLSVRPIPLEVATCSWAVYLCKEENSEGYAISEVDDISEGGDVSARCAPTLMESPPPAAVTQRKESPSPLPPLLDTHLVSAVFSSTPTSTPQVSAKVMEKAGSDFDPLPAHHDQKPDEENTSSDVTDKDVRVYNVLVPKIDNNLGLSIVAARTEEGKDLGIYVKSVVPGGGASQARWLHTDSSRTPQPDDSNANIRPIKPGDRILAVDGRPMMGLSQDSAALLVSSAGCEVHLTIARNLGLGCIAAAVSSDLKREKVTTSWNNDKFMDKPRRMNDFDDDFSDATSTATTTTANSVGRIAIVRASSVQVPNTRQHSVQHVSVDEDTAHPRLLVETNSLIAHAVPSHKPAPMAAIYNRRSLSTDRREFEMEGEDSLVQPAKVYGSSLRRSATISYGNRAPIARPDVDSDFRNLTKKRSLNKRIPHWDETDVDSTLALLQEMRDQLDRSLAYRSEQRKLEATSTPRHTTSVYSPRGSGNATYHSVYNSPDNIQQQSWRKPHPSSSSSRTYFSDGGEGTYERPSSSFTRNPLPVMRENGTSWTEESSAFSTKKLTRSASAYSYTTSSSSPKYASEQLVPVTRIDNRYFSLEKQRPRTVDTKPSGETISCYVYRTPTSSFNAECEEKKLTRSNTTGGSYKFITPLTKTATFITRQSVSNSEQEPVLSHKEPSFSYSSSLHRPANYNSRSFDYAVYHRRHKSSDKTEDEDSSHKPLSVAERIRQFQGAVAH